MVEFALLLPVFAMLVFGAFSGAEAYNQKLTLVAAVREASRYGATLPVTPADSNCTNGSNDIQKWLNCVEQSLVQTATGQLNPGVPGRYICVAYVNSSGTGTPTTKAIYHATDAPTYVTDGTACSTNATGNEPQVDIVGQNSGQLQAILFTQTLTLGGESISRFERLTS